MKTRMKQLAFVLTALFLFTTCNNAKKETDVIKIGAILPLTGDLAEYGLDNKRGTLLAIEDINQSKSLNKRIEVYFEDNQSNPSKAVTSLQKLIATINPSIVLTLGSSISKSISPIIDKKSIILFSVAADQSLNKESKYIFRNFPSAELQTKELVNYIIPQKENNVTVVYINDDFGIANKNSFINEFTSIGGHINKTIEFDKETSNFSTIVLKIKNDNPKNLYIASYGSTLALILKQLLEQNYKGQIYSSLEVGYPNVINIAGKGADGVIYADIPFLSNISDTITAKFIEKFFNRYNVNPTLDALLAYNQILLISKAIDTMKTFNPESLRNNLRSLKNVESITGKLSIDDKQDVIYPVALKTIKNSAPIMLRGNK